MALSMQERRILAQIELHLGEDDPRLAHRLSTLGRPRRSRKARVLVVVGAAAGLILIAAVSAAIAAALT